MTPVPQCSRSKTREHNAHLENPLTLPHTEIQIKLKHNKAQIQHTAHNAHTRMEETGGELIDIIFLLIPFHCRLVLRCPMLSSDLSQPIPLYLNYWIFVRHPRSFTIRGSFIWQASESLGSVLDQIRFRCKITRPFRSLLYVQPLLRCAAQTTSVEMHVCLLLLYLLLCCWGLIIPSFQPKPAYVP